MIDSATLYPHEAVLARAIAVVHFLDIQEIPKLIHSYLASCLVSCDTCEKVESTVKGPRMTHVRGSRFRSNRSLSGVKMAALQLQSPVILLYNCVLYDHDKACSCIQLS